MVFAHTQGVWCSAAVGSRCWWIEGERARTHNRNNYTWKWKLGMGPGHNILWSVWPNWLDRPTPRHEQNSPGPWTACRQESDSGESAGTSSTSTTVILFQPQHRLDRLENYSFWLSEVIYTGSENPKKIRFHFENWLLKERSSWGSDGTSARIWLRRKRWHFKYVSHSDFVSAETSVRAPRKLFVFIIRNNIDRIRKSCEDSI